MNKTQKRKISARRRVRRLPDLEYSKTAILNSLGSPDSRRSYRFANRERRLFPSNAVAFIQRKRPQGGKVNS